MSISDSERYWKIDEHNERYCTGSKDVERYAQGIVGDRERECELESEMTEKYRMRAFLPEIS